MKNKTLFLFLFITFLSFGQQTLFSYDPAGNQTNVFVEINIIAASRMATDSTLLNNPIYKDVKYYPNPVKSELYMEWEVIDENTLSSISVFNLEGGLLKNYNELSNVNNYTLSFDSYPQGIYLVAFLYRNGEQKTFKIIKQ
jgi:hypothetical protein